MSRKSGLLYLGAAISLGSWILVRMLVGFWIPFLWIPIGLFLVFTVLAMYMDRQVYKDFFTTKTTKQGLNQGSLILLVLVLLVAVNFISSRKIKSWDFSIAKVNSLSDQTVQLLKSLKEDLNVIYFYQKGQEGIEESRQQFTELIQKYRSENSLVKLDFVEVNERPDLVEKYGVATGDGVVFLEYQGRRNQIGKIDEQELTGALIKVMRTEDKNIYFVTGHAERDLNSDDANGLQAFKKLLEGNRYKVNSLALSQVTSVPNDADAVFIVGPTQSFLENEIRILEDYLKRGGQMVIAVDPGTKHGLQVLLRKVGVTLKDNYIAGYMDTPIGKAVSPQSTPGGEFSRTHAITKPFPAGQFVVFRLPQALESYLAPKNVVIDELVKVSKNVAAFKSNDFQTAGETGNFTVALSAKGKWNGADNKGAEFQLLVFGDSEFLTKSMLYLNLNRDLALNTTAALVKEENLISITPKEINKTEIIITPMKFYIFVFGFIILLPVALLIASGTLWYKRRFA